MNETQRQFDGGAFVWGLLLIGVGSLLLLDEFHVADFGGLIGTYWPLIIVVIGISKMLRGRVWSGFWAIAIGGWLQAIQLHLADMTLANSWPLLLIIIGGGIVVRSITGTVTRRDGRSHGIEARHD